MLPWFTKYPNQNNEILNLDYVISQVENLKAAYEAFLATNSLTFADPIIWDITKQYSKNTIVLSPEGDAYLSKKVVGKGIQLNNSDYWLEIFNFAEYVRTANSNLTMHIEQNTTRATASYAVDDWLLWEDVLYKVTAAITVDDLLTVGTNIVHFTVEDFCRAWQTYMVNTIQQYKNDIDASELQFNNTMTGLVNQYKNDIDASELAYRNQLALDISQTTDSLQAQLNAAIAGVTVDSEVINSRVGANGITYDTLGDAIRDQLTSVCDAINNGYTSLNASWLPDGYIKSSSPGDVIVYNGWKYTDYIDVSELTHGYLYVERVGTSTTDNSFNAAYDEDLNYLGQLVVPLSGGDVILYPNTKYVRFSCSNSTFMFFYNCLYKDQAVINPIKWYFTGGYSVFYSELITLKAAKYEIGVPNNYLVGYEEYDESGNVKTTGAYDGSKTIWRGNNSSTIKLFIKKSDGTNMSGGDPNLDLVTFKPKESFNAIEYFKLITFNVGLWNDGVSKHPDGTAYDYVKSFRRFLGDVNPELIALLEAPSTINVSNTIQASDCYYFKLPFKAGTNNNSGGMIAVAKNSMLNGQSVTFASGSGRPCYTFDINIAGQRVKCYIVHLSTEADSTGIRQQDLAEIKTWIDAEDYCIVMGDFNTYDMSELDIFPNSYYNVANGSTFGVFITWPNTSASWPNGSIDNIITTKNISLQNVFVPDISLSDHKPLVIEASLYY